MSKKHKKIIEKIIIYVNTTTTSVILIRVRVVWVEGE